MVPSRSAGTSEASFGSAGTVPRRIALRSERDLIHAAVEDVLAGELQASGFVLTNENDDPDAILGVEVRTSDFSPVHLELTMTDAGTGRVLWKAGISREWDLYASIVSASQSNARKAMEMLRADLPVGFRWAGRARAAGDPMVSLPESPVQTSEGFGNRQGEERE